MALAARASDNVAIFLAMSIAEQMPLAEVKNRLSEGVEQVESQHARVTITKHGRPAEVVITAEDLESLEQTLRVLSDPDLLDQVRASRRSQARVRGRFECARFGTFQDGGGDVSGRTFPEVNISGRPRRSDGRLDPWSVGVGQHSSSRTTC